MNNLEQVYRYPVKQLAATDVEEILALQPADLTALKLKQYFAAILSAEDYEILRTLKPEDPDYAKKTAAIDEKTKARFQPNDWFYLEANKFYNKERIKTTIGRYIFNMFCMPHEDPMNYLKKFGYTNEPLTKKELGIIEDNFAESMLELPTEVQPTAIKQYAAYIWRASWLADNISYYITPGLDNAFNVSKSNIIKLRDELFEKYKKELAAGDIDIANKIEKTLVDASLADDKKMNDPTLDFYVSGVFKYPLVAKKTSIMTGVIQDAATGQLKVVKSNYIDGVSKEDYATISTLTVEGGYDRGVATQRYGYETKKLNLGLQNVVIDNTGDDCGTKRTLDLTIPEPLATMFLYRYIVQNGKLIELTPKNINQYAGKFVHLRSPMFCKNDKICTICAGTLFKKLNVENAGLLASNFSGALLNSSMKKMHDSSVRILDVNIDNYISEK